MLADVRIGPHTLSGKALLAPMAGVTDAPFRRLCRRLGAALAPSEMIGVAPGLQHTRESLLRRVDPDEPSPRVVQIAGADPFELADGARFHADLGAEIIDINMGCPAKRVCNVAAGSALLRDERLVGRILGTVARAVNVPVTLKTRTGWSPELRNGVAIARLAEASGVAAIAVHGRTRACRYNGAAEYDTIAAIKSAVRIPVIANGDIDSPAKARAVLAATGADAVMIGRAAQGNPFLFRELNAELDGGEPAAVDAPGLRAIVLEHLQALYRHYGNQLGPRIARKHLAWYLKSCPYGAVFWARICRIGEAARQFAMVEAFFDGHGLAASAA
jgi:tRNA-dihydrouridine synthase B